MIYFIGIVAMKKYLGLISFLAISNYLSVDGQKTVYNFRTESIDEISSSKFSESVVFFVFFQ